MKEPLACTLMLTTSYTSFLEVRNGMEMNLAMLLTILLCSSLTRIRNSARSIIPSWLLATILLATRLESLRSSLLSQSVFV